MKKNRTKVIYLEKYNRRWKWNVGIGLFMCLLIYIVILMVQSIFQVHTNVYEVRRGSIIQDTIYSGLVIRDEMVVNAESQGYIEYYYPELSRVGIGHNIYMISDKATDISIEVDEEFVLTNIQSNEIKNKIQSFNTTYDEGDFNSVYRLKNEIEGILNSQDNEERIRSLDELTQIPGTDYTAYNTGVSGVVLYEIDGYEDTKHEDINTDLFNKQEYSDTLLASGQQINQGDPAYKIITNENWHIYIQISDSDINLLKDLKSMNVRFIKDDITVPASFSLVQINGRNYGKLEFNEGMVRYATDRFLDIELLIDNLEGYKIPITSVTQESYYKIPFDYVITGGYVLHKDSYGSVTRKELSTFYYDVVTVDKETDKTTEAYYYVSVDQFDLNDVIVQEQTNETYILSETSALNLVYNVNRGYARSRYVEILSKSDEYYIIKELPAYSVLNYDYIGLNADEIEEGEFVY